MNQSAEENRASQAEGKAHEVADQANRDQVKAAKQDAELLDTVRDTVVQLNVLLDRLERFASDPTQDEQA